MIMKTFMVNHPNICFFSFKQKFRQQQKFTASYDSMAEFVDCCIDEASSGARPFSIIYQCGETLNSPDGDLSAQMRSDTLPIAPHADDTDSKTLAFTPRSLFSFVVCVIAEYEPGRSAALILLACINEL